MESTYNWCQHENRIPVCEKHQRVRYDFDSIFVESLDKFYSTTREIKTNQWINIGYYEFRYWAKISRETTQLAFLEYKFILRVYEIIHIDFHLCSMVFIHERFEELFVHIKSHCMNSKSYKLTIKFYFWRVSIHECCLLHHWSSFIVAIGLFYIFRSYRDKERCMTSTNLSNRIP